MTNLIVCCDGTWSDADDETDNQPTPTNVRKLFEAIQLAPDAQQQSRYQEGVGTGNAVDKIVGGALGVGLSDDIKDCYQWLCDKFRPGDQIFLFGFSRGAFTVRSLASMIGKYGLLDFDHSVLNISRSDAVRQVFEQGYKARQTLPNGFAFHPDSTSVRFLGVFDTVGALGIPDDKQILNLLDNAQAYRFHDTRLGDHVRTARHAVALDEKRSSFAPTLWTGVMPERDVKQLWFAGVHKDIGGGYLESGLSDCTLKWMTDEAMACGLSFDPGMLEQIQPDPMDVLHDSHRGAMKLLRTSPRCLPDLDAPDNPVLSPTVSQRRAFNPIRQGRYLPTRAFTASEVTVDIYAKHRWYWTGIYLKAGHEYAFSADGEWMDASIACAPTGTEDGSFQLSELVHLAGNALGRIEQLWKRVFSNEQADMFGTRRVEDAPWFALMGSVANGGNPEVDGTPQPPESFEIGDVASFTPKRSGYLYCFANDAWSFYGNNRGYVTLTVREQSE